MKYFFTLLAASLLAGGATAATLAPEAALKRAMAQNSKGMLRVAPASQMELRLTKETPAGEASLYVFAPANGAGFIVASASDRGEALLGWSETEAFDASNLPKGFAWWLEARAHAGAPRVATTTYDAIAPKCTTTWNQDTPYNDLCPMVGGRRSVTGCAATAIAQVMKAYEWPKQGVGTHTDNWEVNGQKYSATVNFSQTTYDWANMLDTYDAEGVNYNETQANAVATLIYHAGVASDMIYSPEMSGAMSPCVGAALINNFNYDAKMSLEMRDWYDQDDWDALVYSELAAGYPMMYCGQSNDGGHAFVCDGYKDGYYHINWGWGGACDGYFLLSDLDPESQGIGGSGDGSGFNSDQEILYNMRPFAGNSTPTPLFVLEGDLYTDKDEYKVATDVVCVNGTIYNYTFGTPTVTIGIKYEDEDGTAFDYEELETLALAIGDGYGDQEYEADGFPEGDYYISYVYKYDGTWYPVRHGLDANYRLHITNDGKTLTIDNPENADGVTVSFQSFTPNYNTDWIFEQNTTYTVKCSVTARRDFEDNLIMMIVDLDTTEGILESEPVSVKVDADGEPFVGEWTINTNCDLGSYMMVICNIPETEDEEPTVYGTVMIEVVAQGGVEAINADNAIKVTPTVTDGPVYLTGLAFGTRVSVYNISGAVVSSFIVSGDATVDLTGSPAGIYLIKAGEQVTRVVRR